MPALSARVFSFAAVMLSSMVLQAGEAVNVRETPLVKAVRECSGAIVNIHTEKSAAAEGEARFLSPRERKVNGMGTGIVVDERGFIVTNFHVIHDVEQIIVTQENGDTYTARPVSYDRQHDLAIIRVHPVTPMKVMDMGTSSDVMLAEQVFAVGNAFGYEHTVTAGIVSAVSRDVEVDETQSYENLIQTDASINPGNSGGPLLNLNGEIIGINVAIRAGAQRIGFAIPIDDARRVIARLLSTERINHVVHGMEGHDVNTADTQQLVVDTVQPGTPAAECGLQAGDVVASVRDIQITDNADWERSLLDLPAGEDVPVVVQRDGEEVSLKLSLRMAQNTATARQSRTVSAASSSSTQTPTAIQTAWQRFGIRLSDLSERERKTLPQPYNGGMKIMFVQSGGTGARYGLRNGDVLVGLDGYETLGERNLEFLLSQQRLQSKQRMTFRIIRGGKQALTGTLQWNTSRRTSGRNSTKRVSGTRR